MSNGNTVYDEALDELAAAAEAVIETSNRHDPPNNGETRAL